jgi:hypothetical protein
MSDLAGPITAFVLLLVFFGLLALMFAPGPIE